ncbi:MAG: DUF2304 domain-containing protein [Planctomycetia bacterium]|nr:MAG: DUF2304 domain-containing protein [Planctomycetia bacterium]
MTVLLAAAAPNLFQVIVLPLLLLATCWMLWQWLVHRRRRLAAGTLVLLCAMIGVANPGLTTSVASTVGIGRGTDLVVYITAFALIGVTFAMLAMHRRSRMEITELTRQLALRELPPSPVAPGDATTAERV